MNDEVSEEEILTGQPALAEDAFWARKIWELEADGPALLTEAGQQLMGLVAVLSGIYLATLGLLGVEKAASTALRVLSLTPYLAWLPAFVFAYLAQRPQRFEVPGGSAKECRREILDLTQRKSRWIFWAQALLFVGLLLAVGWVGSLLINGLVPEPPAATGQGG